MAKRRWTLKAMTMALASSLTRVLLPSLKAGEYHKGINLKCSECHTMHYSQRPTYQGNPFPGEFLAPGGPFEKLLRARESRLCLSCHDGQTFAPDGLGDNTYAKGTNDTTKDVFLRGWTLRDITTNYSVDNGDFNEPDPTDSAIGRFCRGCHTAFHGGQGDSNMGGGGRTNWLRHPSADADIGAIGGEYSRLTVFGSHAYRGKQGQTWANPPSGLTPPCITCYKAHGNKNPFGLILLKGTGPIMEEGDREGQQEGVRSLCKQCHVQGGLSP